MEGKLDPAWKYVSYANLILFLTVVSLIFSVPITLSPGPISSIFMAILIIIILAMTIVTLIGTNTYYKNFSYEIGRDFVRISKGLITKQETKIPYKKIQNVDTVRGMMQRLFGIATIQIQTAGASVLTPGTIAEGMIPGVRNPEKITEAIMKKVVSRK